MWNIPFLLDQSISVCLSNSTKAFQCSIPDVDLCLQRSASHSPQTRLFPLTTTQTQARVPAACQRRNSAHVAFISSSGKTSECAFVLVREVRCWEALLPSAVSGLCLLTCLAHSAKRLPCNQGGRGHHGEGLLEDDCAVRSDADPS